ncbi:hypothetical protein [Kitasatospora sp. NPDC059571]|uniref:hypothetical protein n=1 Tax=Kitasatospora sp. NPDC059571 TaxID=3346871 RepID=UPI0036CC6712
MTVQTLSYELRRLRGLRSSWLIAAVVLVADLAVALTAVWRTPALDSAAAVRASTGVVPFLPLPVAALGAGLLGVLSYTHEVRYPGLAASRVAFGRRAGLLAAKAAVTGAAGAVLAAATVLLGALAVGLAARGGAPAADRTAALRTADLVAPFAACAVLVVGAAWAGLLAAALVRRLVPALLLFLALPVVLEPLGGLMLRRTGRSWPFGAAELLPLRELLDRVPVDGFARTVPDGLLLALPLLPVALLLAAGLALQLHRRTL